MIDWTTVGIISIIINIVMLPLVFFKSAINEILKEWWISKRKKREETIKRLVEFKRKFILYQGQIPLLMLAMAQKQAAIIMGREVDLYMEDVFQDSSKKVGEIDSSISEFKDFLPVDLRAIFDRYQKQWLEIIRKIMEGHVTKEDFLGYNEILTTVASEGNDLADSMIRKYLD